ncbi:hypothetical protein T265_15718, partial [Opisthorchis viverrini]
MNQLHIASCLDYLGFLDEITCLTQNFLGQYPVTYLEMTLISGKHISLLRALSHPLLSFIFI